MMSATRKTTTDALETIWHALDGTPRLTGLFREVGVGDLPSTFAVSDLAAASIGAAGLALAEWCMENGVKAAQVQLDRRLASLWFSFTIRPEGWALPPAWDSIAGDYRTADGWVRLHTNAAHHRSAALSILGCDADRNQVAAAVANYSADDLETAIVAAGGCAATMRSRTNWLAHPQGAAVAMEPLIYRLLEGDARTFPLPFNRNRPLQGIKVLDLTRILAGPAATRLLAGLGADVLRIDPPGWEEPSLEAEMTLGKRCARLDLATETGRSTFRALLSEADILVSGYRPDALEKAGFGVRTRRTINPGLVDVSLSAYGWAGPWANRRGFDSLVQMSAGIADRGMQMANAQKPVPLPVQALDHATGYLLAASAIRGLTCRLRESKGSNWRSSLARVAELLFTSGAEEPRNPLEGPGDADYAPLLEQTAWGPAQRMRPPIAMDEITIAWNSAATSLGTDTPCWR